jgi:glycosyltransferase involved in cell wall biosynthesis
MGYDVVLLTDEPPSPDDYELPEGVRRVVIPACRVLTRDSYLERAQALVIALRENEVDALVFHAWASPLMLWDLLVCKLSGVSFFVHCHGIFSQLARKATPYFADMPAVYALADGVITLGEVDRAYWSFFNTSVTAVLNPLSFEPAQTQRASLADKTILWLGRLSDEKRPEDALKIFAKVLEREPEARMEMVGSSSDDKYLRRLQKLARALGVEDAVSMHGFHREVMPFYARAAVLLMTSEYEGFGMVLTESQSLGLPCVMYELPYLTAVRTGRGIVPVEMGDIDSAADAVADILADREYRLKLGRDARANAEELATFDYHGAWRGVFEGSSSARGDLDPDIVSVMWETLHGHYRIGARARSTEVAKLKDEIAFGVGPAGLIRRMRRGLRRKWKRLLRPKS